VAGFVPFAFDDDDPDELLAAALGRLVDALPGWTPNPLHLEYAVLAEVTRAAHETRQVASDVAAAIFRYFGESLVGIPPRPGSPATGSAVFTLTDLTGRTIPAGTSVLWPVPGGDAQLFTTAADVTAAVGVADTPAVQLIAAEVGEQGNGLAAGALELVDALAYVDRVTATTASSGGTDAETDADYLDRLAESLTLLRRIPVLARDFAILARDVPGVHRALAVDGLNPDTGTTGLERTVAVAAVDAEGQPVAANVATALDTRLESEREVNFDVRTMTPTYTVLAVVFDAVAALDADPAAVLADARQAVLDYLSPARWAGGDETPPVWRLQATVGYLDVAGVIKATPGVGRLIDVTLNGARVDVALAGYAPLPSAASTVDGTVSAP
jgi:hypothetical protein